MITNDELETRRIMKKGNEAWRRLLAADPKLREQTARYTAARRKLRAGMLAMLEHHHRQEAEVEADLVATGWAVNNKDRELWRQEARTFVLAEIGNYENSGQHVSIPENELSISAFWALSEAYEAICTEDLAWHCKEQSK